MSRDPEAADEAADEAAEGEPEAGGPDEEKAIEDDKAVESLPAEGEAAPAEGAPALPEPTLQLHLFHLASQVSMALGEIQNPITQEKQVDLPTARFLIDTIALLDTKTDGNRTAEEDEYIKGVLTNLCMAYVNKSGSP